jgi:hypothetical protein
MHRSSLIFHVLILLALSLVLGAGMQALGGLGSFITGWLGASALLWIGALVMYAAWRLAGGGRALGGMLLAAFVLRLGLGILLGQLLPVYGFPQPEQQAGYSSKDAFHRDNQAWELASSGKPLTLAFTSTDYNADQYGGMLALSSLVYRGLSPDVHRPALILILTAVCAALGLPFFYSAVRKKLGAPIALLAGWILAAYPETIFWGASQMREPLLITLAAMAFWAAIYLREHLKTGLAVLAISLAALFLMSNMVALAVIGLLAGWLWLDLQPEGPAPLWKILNILVLIAGVVVLAGLSWSWLKASASFDIGQTQRASGILQYALTKLGQRWQAPIIVLYGLIRPVLPGAIFDPTLPLWQTLWIVRSLGWYLAAPVFIYALFTLLRLPGARDRRLLLWLGLFSVIWMVIASARGGGDDSDNPRYRQLLIPFTALLVAWGIAWARSHRDAWIWRWLAVDAIFVLGFSQWYAARYWRLPFMIEIFPVIVITGLLCAAVLAGGWWSDRQKKLTPPKD